MKIQNYKDGEIHRRNGKFIFMRNEQVVGTYISLDDLVSSFETVKLSKKVSRRKKTIVKK